MGGNCVESVGLTPAAIVLVAHNYHFSQVALLVALLAALGCAALHARVPHRDGSPSWPSTRRGARSCSWPSPSWSARCFSIKSAPTLARGGPRIVSPRS